MGAVMSSLDPIGIRVANLRIARNMRQADLGEKMDVSAAWISSIECGNAAINPSTIAKLKVAMRLSDRVVKSLHRSGAREAGWDV